MNKEEALSLLQASTKRREAQQYYNLYLQAARKNYTEKQLIEMSAPYLTDELRAAWLDGIYELTLYKKPANKLKKYQLFHELLNINYDFSKLEKTPDGSAPKRGRKPTEKPTPENTSATKIQSAFRNRLARRAVERIAMDALKSLKTGVAGRPKEDDARKALVAYEKLATKVNLRVNKKKYSGK